MRHPVNYRCKGLSQKDFLLVYSYYDRWVNGEVGVGMRLVERRNTAYIFALLDNNLSEGAGCFKKYKSEIALSKPEK